jgi:pyruvate kinase
MGNFPTGHFDVEKGMPVTFKSAENSEDPNLFIPVEYPKIASYVKIGQEFSLMDGEVGFRVTKIVSDDKFVAEAVNKWHISALKGVNLGRSIDELEHITEKTVAHLKELHKINPEWVAFSFVNSGQFAKKTRRLLKDISTPSWQPKLVAKVETEKGVKNIDDISAVVDVVLVARGDLGLAMPYEKLGISQKKIVLSARKHKKLVIVSTQILDSLLSYFVPSRAEVLDLTNIILDGADGIMLAKETGISLTPGFSVSVAKKIIDSVEKSKNSI